MKRLIQTIAPLALALAAIAPANAQYIARRLQQEAFSQTASGISGNTVAGTYGASATRNRYDGILWNAQTGVPTYIANGATSFQGIDGQWVIKDGGDYRIYTSYNPLSATNLVTGQSLALSYSSSSQSNGFDHGTAGIRGGWAWGNQQNHPSNAYNSANDAYSSRLVNLETGAVKNFSWEYAPFSYVNRQFVDVSGGKILQAAYGAYSLRDIETDVVTDLTTGLSGIVGMSGTKIAGNTASGAGLYDYVTNTATTFSKIGLTNTGIKQIGNGQSVGDGTNAATNKTNALRWDNATGAVTNLQAFLGTGYTASSVISVDKSVANGGILLSATRTNGASDYIALRQFAGSVVGIGDGEIATFIDDYTQTGGVVVNEGTIQWTNPPHYWNLQNGLLTGTGNFYGNLVNGGGTLSGGGAGGSGGGNGGGGGGGGFGGSGGAGSGVGNFAGSGTYSQSGNGTILLSIASGTSFDTFTFGGTATLGGILQIDLLGAYAPNVGQEFAFFAAPNTVGTWDSVYSPGQNWQVVYNPGGASVIYRGSTAVVPEAGTLALSLLGVAGTLGVVVRRRARKA